MDGERSRGASSINRAQRVGVGVGSGFNCCCCFCCSRWTVGNRAVVISMFLFSCGGEVTPVTRFGGGHKKQHPRAKKQQRPPPTQPPPHPLLHALVPFMKSITGAFVVSCFRRVLMSTAGAGLAAAGVAAAAAGVATVAAPKCCCTLLASASVHSRAITIHSYASRSRSTQGASPKYIAFNFTGERRW